MVSPTPTSRPMRPATVTTPRVATGSTFPTAVSRLWPMLPTLTDTTLMSGSKERPSTPQRSSSPPTSPLMPLLTKRTHSWDATRLCESFDHETFTNQQCLLLFIELFIKYLTFWFFTIFVEKSENKNLRTIYCFTCFIYNNNSCDGSK